MCMVLCLGPGFEPIWDVTMRLASTPRNRNPNPPRALDSHKGNQKVKNTHSHVYNCLRGRLIYGDSGARTCEPSREVGGVVGPSFSMYKPIAVLQGDRQISYRL